MTLKGIPQFERNIQWHKRHEKRLLKNKARRLARKNLRKNININRNRLPFSVEKAKKFADEKQKRKEKLKMFAKIWIWFINLIK